MKRRWPSILSRQNQTGESTVLWDSSVFFFGLGLPFLVLLAMIDPSEINGEPRWLKPIKFFLSIGLYNLTLEWIFRVFRTDGNVRQFNRIRWVIAVGMLIEAVLLLVQAARGVQSHFNVATPLDGLIFGIMGIIISLVVLAAFSSGFLIWKARARAPSLIGEAVLYGLILMTAASFQGFAMTEATPEQQEARELGERLLVEGSHFVGEPPENHRTVPLVGWSLDVGDLRIAHFIGLHSLQLFLLFAFALHTLEVPASRALLRGGALLYGSFFLFAFLKAYSGTFLF
jgi:hypothetical protein